MPLGPALASRLRECSAPAGLEARRYHGLLDRQLVDGLGLGTDDDLVANESRWRCGNAEQSGFRQAAIELGLVLLWRWPS